MPRPNRFRRANALCWFRSPAKPDSSPKAVHFLRGFRPPTATQSSTEATMICTYHGGVRNHIEALDLGPKVCLSRDDLLYFHAELQATIAAVEMPAKAYYNLRHHQRWDERQLIEVTQMSDRLKCILGS
ncbi:hypothetical protein CspeluHIS016_0108940 [Cutaneotrichosporon spelunceum]|uniref:Uncharacterized protein n=1 Tax=Cutaneotrichosporon spelunceum TaxID=1672016 RepID=A0AAD3Y9T2_9TREE|nr:hypothetical protein CspeluHIS016_0108940 [Cutaneotrichosporon spelunceum]